MTNRQPGASNYLHPLSRVLEVEFSKHFFFLIITSFFTSLAYILSIYCPKLKPSNLITASARIFSLSKNCNVPQFFHMSASNVQLGRIALSPTNPIHPHQTWRNTTFFFFSGKVCPIFSRPDRFTYT